MDPDACCVLMPCRALEAFRPRHSPCFQRIWSPSSLNALSGIGGVQTYLLFLGYPACLGGVLMPCRALEAFRRYPVVPPEGGSRHVLMPCRALEAFRRGAGSVRFLPGASRS